MASLRRNARWWVMIGLGAALLGIAGTAAAVIMLSGKGALT
jgi:hypothetical protein